MKLREGSGSLLALLVPAKPKTKPAEAEPLLPPTPPPAGNIKYDFGTDGKADIGRWHPANAEFKVKDSSTGAFLTYTLGTSSAKAAPGDFNGDGKTDAGVFNAGTWTYKTSPGATAMTISFGSAGDMPVAGDYDGDGTTDAAVFRPSTNTWYVRQSSNLATVTYAFGSTGDIPIPGNFDGDGKTDYAVYRPSTGYWHIQQSTAGSTSIPWGSAIDTPVQGDFDGDGKSDPAVFRPSTGTWYVMKSEFNYTTTITQVWGNYGDQPAPADYDGDGKSDLCIWRPTTGQWYTLGSLGGQPTDVLGVPGDTAIPSAYTKQVSGAVTGDELAAMRLNPKNATGGTNLYSQNFSWGRSLVSLPGRAGMDAGLGISYNSLIWAKSGSSILFDPDTSNVTPGFRLGYATIEPVYYDAVKQLWAYMMVNQDGSRTEFRQTAVTNTYVAVDSSYAQLAVSGATNPNDPVENLTIYVTSTDGTVSSYAWLMGAYRCVQIRERNGNYLSIAYDGLARLDTVTDTLGRVIKVNYGAGGPSTITQTWRTGNGDGGTTTHTWATFSYVTPTVTTNFHGSLAVFGPPNGTVMNVLDKITYADGSSTKFEYNGYLQVYKVSNVAANLVELNSVSTNLQTPALGQQDCPRFTETYTSAQNFNGGLPVTISNRVTPGQSYYLPHTSGTATRIQVWMPSHPDYLRSNTFVSPSGWNEGLPVATEDCLTTSESDCSNRKRWTSTVWTQDNTGVAYPLNPRVTETRVGDGMNTKKTTIDYRYDIGTSSYLYGLPELVKVHDAALGTVLKTQKTTYNLDAAYTSRRIIGLPSETSLWEGTDTAGTLMSKVTYAYDDENFSQETNQIITPTRHDTTNYGSSFIVGRGNMTLTARHDVTGQTAAVTSRVRYDIAGSPVARLDSLNRKVAINYTDVFNSTGNPATYAYATTITDPNNQSSTVKYRYDIGANVEATSPPPAGQTYGKTSKRTFDDKGRLERNSVWVSTAEKAYTRHAYPSNGTQSQTYSTVVDYNNSGGPDSADEVLSESWFDGSGRVRQSRTDHPGSIGLYSGSLVEYDILGRVKRTTVPTEINSSWQPAGDDYRGTDVWLWNTQEYDWKNRVTRTVPSDSTGSDGKDTLITYEGCGCAGGQVTTVKGPVTTAVDVAGNTQTTKRRTQKAYEDILGRTFKTEIWDLDGGGTYAPYSTVKSWFNGRDQATLIREYSGSDSSSTFQDKTATYDGHGRLSTSHKPEERTSSNTPAYTTYNYNLDDSISSMTDGRGVVTSYTYENVSGVPKRPLVTNIAWNVGSTGVEDTPDIGYAYDSAGNRTAMTDGLGSVSYAYNSLSQMTGETRQFTALSGQSFAIGYTYNLAGQVKTVTDPSSKVVTYDHYKNGKLKTVNGTGYGVSVPFISDTQYRAWGAVKQVTYGNGVQTSLGFNSKLSPTSYQLTNVTNQGTLGSTYAYYNDGTMQSSENLGNDNFDRALKYDHAGRIKNALTGTQAHGGSTADGPYEQTYGYDAFGNTASYGHREWTGSFTTDNTMNTNNRRSTFQYSELGQVTSANDGVQSYNAAAMRTTFASLVKWTGTWGYLPAYEANTAYAGDGAPAKQTVTTRSQDGYTTGTVTAYYVRSTVLGGKAVTELDATGAWKSSTAYAEGMKLATYVSTFPTNVFSLHHMDPVTGNEASSDGGAYSGGFNQLDPLGSDVTIAPDPNVYEEPPYLDPTSVFSSPIENRSQAWAWEGDIALADWGERIQNTRDTIRAEHYWATGRRGLAIDIISQNPNVGIDVRMTGFGLDGPRSGTIFGSEAAGFLTRLNGALHDGSLVEAGGSRGDNPPYTKAMEACDKKLASLFGDKNAVAAGNDFEPLGMFGEGRAYRGPTKEAPTEGEFTNMMHLYGSSDGTQYTGVYVPPNSSSPYANPRAYDSDKGGSYVFYYKNLGLPGGGILRDVSLVVSHIKDYRFDPQNRNGSNYISIGQVGGPGGDSGGKYRHVHMTLVSGKVTARKKLGGMKRIGIADSFCK